MTLGGYFEGGEYESFGLYSHLIPTRMRFMAALHGYAAPALAGPFRYCELGCGQAMTLLLSAALFPQAHFVGVDFSASAIDRAKSVAKRMGLTNVTLICSDFASFADGSPEPFDFLVSHGVWTWVGPETQASIVRILAETLAPRGVACLSANIIFGWQKALSIQHFLLCATAAEAPNHQATLAKALLARLATVAGEASGRTEKIASVLRQTPSYFSHEYLAPAWKPITLVDLIAASERAGLSWLGSGQARHGVEALWAAPDASAAVPADVPRAARSSAIDALMGTAFRAELFGKDVRPAAEGDKRTVLKESRLVVLNAALAAEAVATVMKTLQCADALFEQALIAQLQTGAIDAADILTLPADETITLDFAYDVICGLLVTAVCDLTLALRPSEAQRAMVTTLNQARVALAAEGHEILALASPATGALAPVDSIDLAHLIANGSSDGAVIERAADLLRRKEARTLINGAPPPDADAAFDRMVRRACGIWPLTGAKRLAALGIAPASQP